MNNKKEITGPRNADSVPQRILSYLKRHYNKSYFKDVKKIKRNGQVFYHVNIEKENNIFRIKFNSDGYLMQKVMEPIIDAGVVEEYGGGD